MEERGSVRLAKVGRLVCLWVFFHLSNLMRGARKVQGIRKHVDGQIYSCALQSEGRGLRVYGTGNTTRRDATRWIFILRQVIQHVHVRLP